MEPFVDSLQGPVDISTGLEVLLDTADRREHRGVVAVEAAGDLGEREVGLVAGDVHGELPAPHEVWLPTRGAHVGRREMENVADGELDPL